MVHSSITAEIKKKTPAVVDFTYGYADTFTF